MKRQKLKVWTAALVVSVIRHLGLALFAPAIAIIWPVPVASLRIHHQNSER